MQIFDPSITGSLVATGSSNFVGDVVVTGNVTASGDIIAQSDLVSSFSSGDEGGEILLAKAQTNTTLTGSGIIIDSYQNKLRIFEQGGNARGAYIDLTACSNGATTNLLAVSSAGSNKSVQFNDIGTTSGSANFTFDKATNIVSVTGSVVATSLSGSFSGSYVGDGSGLTGITATSTPAGPDKSIQFNDAGSTSGSGNFTFHKTTNIVSVTGSIIATSFTGSLEGTASLATSASYALTASFAPVESSTSGVGVTPTATQTDTITHGLGRTPIKIRIYGASQFTSNASATATPFSIGTWTSSGNRCIYQPYNTAAITTTQAAATSTTFAVRVDTAANVFVTGVIQNVGATTFQIAWTETGAAVARVYMWEAE